METPFLLIVLGLLVGTFGTLVGAGGGFILMPIFFYLYPNEPPERLTAMSLAIVFFNAASGSIAYGRKGRIDYRSAVAFAAASVPGAILGAFATSRFSRGTFDPIFGGVLAVVSLYLLFRPGKHAPAAKPVSNGTGRILVERDGTKHHLDFSMQLGLAISVGVGFLSSLLGIGGGIIHVPALTLLLRFPVHVATATSHFILAVMVFFGSAVHLYSGDYAGNFDKVACLAPSVIVGAQIGAALSHRVHGRWIIRVLAAAIGFVGIRLLLKAFIPS